MEYPVQEVWNVAVNVSMPQDLKVLDRKKYETFISFVLQLQCSSCKTFLGPRAQFPARLMCEKFRFSGRDILYLTNTRKTIDIFVNWTLHIVFVKNVPAVCSRQQDLFSWHRRLLRQHSTWAQSHWSCKRPNENTVQQILNFSYLIQPSKSFSLFQNYSLESKGLGVEIESCPVTLPHM